MPHRLLFRSRSFVVPFHHTSAPPVLRTSPSIKSLMSSLCFSSTAMPRLHILFLCTAHNSLSQRLFLALQRDGHHITVELAINENVMIEAVAMVKPDLIIAPFLTRKVPAQVYENYLTLIVHPGPPGDAGPSAMDWMLLGDDGTEPDAALALAKVTDNDAVARHHGRSHWGLTVLQAMEEFDAGPVWAWDQFAVALDGSAAPTKASLYRGAITTAAILACRTAIQRIVEITAGRPISPALVPLPMWQQCCVSRGQTFLGGPTTSRPLLKPAERSWDPSIHSSALISRRLRASDSQPGVQSTVLGKNLYLYGGAIEENPIPWPASVPGSIVASRDNAILLSTADGKGIWITHIRRLKAKTESLLPAKLPALQALMSLPEMVAQHKLDTLPEWTLNGFNRVPGTFQEVWIDYKVHSGLKTAHIYSDFYNGAASTLQCNRLLEAIQSALSNGIGALVLMGGSYFNNGIHLGVCSENVGPESWKNINAINDCVQAILETRDVVTFAAVRGNIAAGGVALATCCDFVIATDNVVLNPHYRAVSLYGSEYHSLTWNARAGEEQTRKMMRDMLPMDPYTAHTIGLVDWVVPAAEGDVGINSVIDRIIARTNKDLVKGAPWIQPMDSDDQQDSSWLSTLGQCKENWFSRLPQPLSEYRRQELDYMKICFVDERYHACVKSFVGKEVPRGTPFRFALHRRFQHWFLVRQDAGEAPDYFDFDHVDSEGINRALGLPGAAAICPCQPPPLNWCSSPVGGPRLKTSSSRTPSSRSSSSDMHSPPTPPLEPTPHAAVDSLSLNPTLAVGTPSFKLKGQRTFVMKLKRIMRGFDKQPLNVDKLPPPPPPLPLPRQAHNTGIGANTPATNTIRTVKSRNINSVLPTPTKKSSTPLDGTRKEKEKSESAVPLHMLTCYYQN